MQKIRRIIIQYDKLKLYYPFEKSIHLIFFPILKDCKAIGLYVNL